MQEIIEFTVANIWNNKNVYKKIKIIVTSLRVHLTVRVSLYNISTKHLPQTIIAGLFPILFSAGGP
jgi:hypothetical protein